MSRLTRFVMIPAAISLLVISALGIWLQLTILNQDTFANSVSTAVTQKSSRDAIATAVVDRILQDRPLVQSVVRDPVEGVISGALSTSLFAGAIDRVSQAAWQEVFVRGGQSLTLNLVPAKRLLAGVFDLIGTNNTISVNAADVPDQIVLFENGQLPDLRWLRTAGPLVTWISAIAGLALVGITFWTVHEREDRIRLVGISGIVLALEAVGVLLLTLLLRAIVVANVTTESGKSVIQDLLRAFFRSLSVGLILLMLLGFVLYAAARWMKGTSFSFEPGAQRAAAEPADRSRKGPEHA